MNIFRSLFAASFLVAGTAYAIGFGFEVGPFNMQLNTPEIYVEGGRALIDSPICEAITTQARLELIVEGIETVSTKEKKLVTKKLIVEPYAFGITRTGAPLLRGNVVEEKLVKEVTMKYEDDVYDEESISSDKKKEGFFSGLFSSDKKVTIDIRKVSDIRVIAGSHFDIPSNYTGINDPNIQVVCELPIPK